MTAEPTRRTVLFHRDFRGFAGGHLKVWHYFNHVAAAPRYRPLIHFTPQSLRDDTNPWSRAGTEVVPWAPAAADVLFLAGFDWAAVPPAIDRPVVNLVQGFGHAVPGDPRHEFLARRAVRICVSGEVADALRATGRVNGPILTIPNAVDHDAFPEPAGPRDIPVLVAGAKRPDLAHAVAAELGRRGVAVHLVTAGLGRTEFLALLARAEIAVPLPLAEEGCFLPGLEGMALGALVVCPDCRGNRGWCRDGETGFRPAPTPEAIAAAVVAARALPPAERAALAARGRAAARSRSLADERREFLAILERLDELV